MIAKRSVSFFIAISLLSGCSTDFSRSPGSLESPHTKAQQHLKLAQETTTTQSLLHRLQAADYYIQAGEIFEAQQLLRTTQTKISPQEASLRKPILEMRLALLKKDRAKARVLLKEAIATLQAEENLSAPTLPLAETQGGLRIGLLLPSKGPHAEAAKTIRDGFLAAYYKTLKHQPSDPSVKVYDTGVGNKIREAYQNALADHVTLIVGPLTKSEVQVMANMPQIDVPVLALNTVTEDSKLPPQLFQFGLMPEDEVVAVANLAMRHKNQRALILAPQTDWGQRLAATFKQYWKSQGGSVIDVKFYTSNQSLAAKVPDLLQVNAGRRRQDADMIFLAATPEVAKQIKSLLNLHHAADLPVYSTAAVYSGTSPVSQELDGIRFCDMPWVLSMSGEWPKHSNQSPRYFALGMDAYQLALQVGANDRFPSYGFSGYTGVLRLNAYRRVQRELVCAKFENGHVVPD